MSPTRSRKRSTASTFYFCSPRLRTWSRRWVRTPSWPPSMRRSSTSCGTRRSTPPMTPLPAPDAAQQAMRGFGRSRWFVGNVVDYGRVYSEGWGDFVTNDFKDVTGHEARSFQQFATDFAAAFGGAKVPAAH